MAIGAECGREIVGQPVRTATRTLDSGCAASVNAIAYGMLNGGSPFDGPAAAQSARRHAQPDAKCRGPK
ncbi:hypothetical protein QF011_003461 [Curtobacterium flaccumfaciens]|nr:hypothetical protein [Curtobacterium flaccumfaciens]